MKSNIYTSILVALFLFAMNSTVVKADSDAVLYHNVETVDNVVSTTYFKGDVQNNNLVPFKKSVNTMNEQGSLVSKVTYMWNAVNNTWNPSNKMVYSYNGTKVAGVARYTWNERTKVWGEPQQMAYSHNEN